MNNEVASLMNNEIIFIIQVSSFLFVLLSFLFSLKMSFPDKRQKNIEKR